MYEGAISKKSNRCTKISGEREKQLFFFPIKEVSIEAFKNFPSKSAISHYNHFRTKEWLIQ